MGKLTIDISETAHHHLRVIASFHGLTIKDYVLDKLMPELSASIGSEESLPELATAWEERRKEFRLERGEQSMREIIHEGHKW